MLWGDHGWHLSEKGIFAKGTLFETAIRAPLIVVDPRRKDSAGQTCRRIVQFVDIYPTLADLAGLPLPPALEGVSLRPLLDDPDAAWDKPAFTVQSRGWSLGRRIRTERWAYSEWDNEPVRRDALRPRYRSPRVEEPRPRSRPRRNRRQPGEAASQQPHRPRLIRLASHCKSRGMKETHFWTLIDCGKAARG